MARIALIRGARAKVIAVVNQILTTFPIRSCFSDHFFLTFFGLKDDRKMRREMIKR